MAVNNASFPPAAEIHYWLQMSMNIPAHVPEVCDVG